jgi:hypothetical protein
MPTIQRSLFVALLASLVQVMPLSAACAATQNAPPAAPSTPAPAPRVIRAPLAPPPINDMTRAYEFRTQLSGNPQCQRFATEADAVFLSSELDDAQKEAKLKVIGDAARAAGCVN